MSVFSYANVLRIKCCYFCWLFSRPKNLLVMDFQFSINKLPKLKSCPFYLYLCGWFLCYYGHVERDLDLDIYSVFSWKLLNCCKVIQRAQNTTSRTNWKKVKGRKYCVHFAIAIWQLYIGQIHIYNHTDNVTQNARGRT